MNLPFNLFVFNIEPKYLKLIKEKKKSFEIRKNYFPDLYDQMVGLRNIDTNKIELVIRVGEIISLKDLEFLNEDAVEEILEQACVTKEFREKYPCNYAYEIKSIITVH